MSGERGPARSGERGPRLRARLRGRGRPSAGRVSRTARSLANGSVADRTATAK